MNLSAVTDQSYLQTGHLGEVETILLRRMPGPIIQPEDLPNEPAAQALLEHFDNQVSMLRARYRFDEAIRLCLIGEACPVQNACALRTRDGTYYVALPYEMVSHLYYQVELVLACEPFQKAFHLPAEIVQLTMENARTFPRANGHPVIKHTPVSMGLARAFGEAVVVTVLLHELGHILNGHLGVMAGAGQVLEEQAKETEPDAQLTQQTLEFDADCFAAVQTLDIFAHGHGIPPLLAPLCRSRDDSVKLGVAIVYLMFRSFDDGAAWTSDTHRQPHSHPPARMRMALSREALGRAICRALGVTPEEAALSYILQPMLAIEEAQLLLGRDMGWLETLEAQSADVSEYLLRLLRRWARIRPVLTEHKIGTQNLAPASQLPD